MAAMRKIICFFTLYSFCLNLLAQYNNPLDLKSFSFNLYDIPKYDFSTQKLTSSAFGNASLNLQTNSYLFPTDIKFQWQKGYEQQTITGYGAGPQGGVGFSFHTGLKSDFSASYLKNPVTFNSAAFGFTNVNTIQSFGIVFNYQDNQMLKPTYWGIDDKKGLVGATLLTGSGLWTMGQERFMSVSAPLVKFDASGLKLSKQEFFQFVTPGKGNIQALANVKPMYNYTTSADDFFKRAYQNMPSLASAPQEFQKAYKIFDPQTSYYPKDTDLSKYISVYKPAIIHHENLQEGYRRLDDNKKISESVWAKTDQHSIRFYERTGETKYRQRELHPMVPAAVTKYKAGEQESVRGANVIGVNTAVDKETGLVDNRVIVKHGGDVISYSEKHQFIQIKESGDRSADIEKITRLSDFRKQEGKYDNWQEASWATAMNVGITRPLGKEIKGHVIEHLSRESERSGIMQDDMANWAKISLDNNWKSSKEVMKLTAADAAPRALLFGMGRYVQKAFSPVDKNSPFLNKIDSLKNEFIEEKGSLHTIGLWRVDHFTKHSIEMFGYMMTLKVGGAIFFPKAGLGADITFGATKGIWAKTLAHAKQLPSLALEWAWKSAPMSLLNIGGIHDAWDSQAALNQGKSKIALLASAIVLNYGEFFTERFGNLLMPGSSVLGGKSEIVKAVAGGPSEILEEMLSVGFSWGTNKAAGFQTGNISDAIAETTIVIPSTILMGGGSSVLSFVSDKVLKYQQRLQDNKALDVSLNKITDISPPPLGVLSPAQHSQSLVDTKSVNISIPNNIVATPHTSPTAASVLKSKSADGSATASAFTGTQIPLFPSLDVKPVLAFTYIQLQTPSNNENLSRVISLGKQTPTLVADRVSPQLSLNEGKVVVFDLANLGLMNKAFGTKEVDARISLAKEDFQKIPGVVQFAQGYTGIRGMIEGKPITSSGDEFGFILNKHANIKDITDIFKKHGLLYRGLVTKYSDNLDANALLWGVKISDINEVRTSDRITRSDKALNSTQQQTQPSGVDIYGTLPFENIHKETEKYVTAFNVVYEIDGKPVDRALKVINENYGDMLGNKVISAVFSEIMPRLQGLSVYRKTDEAFIVSNQPLKINKQTLTEMKENINKKLAQIDGINIKVAKINSAFADPDMAPNLISNWDYVKTNLNVPIQKYTDSFYYYINPSIVKQKQQDLADLKNLYLKYGYDTYAKEVDKRSFALNLELLSQAPYRIDAEKTLSNAKRVESGGENIEQTDFQPAYDRLVQQVRNLRKNRFDPTISGRGYTQHQAERIIKLIGALGGLNPYGKSLFDDKYIETVNTSVLSERLKENHKSIGRFFEQYNKGTILRSDKLQRYYVFGNVSLQKGLYHERQEIQYIKEGKGIQDAHVLAERDANRIDRVTLEAMKLYERDSKPAPLTEEEFKIHNFAQVKCFKDIGITSDELNQLDINKIGKNNRDLFEKHRAILSGMTRQEGIEYMAEIYKSALEGYNEAGRNYGKDDRFGRTVLLRDDMRGSGALRSLEFWTGWYGNLLGDRTSERRSLNTVGTMAEKFDTSSINRRETFKITGNNQATAFRNDYTPMVERGQQEKRISSDGDIIGNTGNNIINKFILDVTEKTILAYQKNGFGETHPTYHNLTHTRLTSHLMAIIFDNLDIQPENKPLLSKLSLVAALLHDWDFSKERGLYNPPLVSRTIEQLPSIYNTLQLSPLEQKIITTLILRTEHPWGDAAQQRYLKEKDSLPDNIKKDVDTVASVLTLADKGAIYVLGTKEQAVNAVYMLEKELEHSTGQKQDLLSGMVKYFLEPEVDPIIRYLPKELAENYENNKKYINQQAALQDKSLAATYIEGRPGFMPEPNLTKPETSKTDPVIYRAKDEEEWLFLTERNDILTDEEFLAAFPRPISSAQTQPPGTALIPVVVNNSPLQPSKPTGLSLQEVADMIKKEMGNKVLATSQKSPYHMHIVVEDRSYADAHKKHPVYDLYVSQKGKAKLFFKGSPIAEINNNSAIELNKVFKKLGLSADTPTTASNKDLPSASVPPSNNVFVIPTLPSDRILTLEEWNESVEQYDEIGPTGFDPAIVDVRAEVSEPPLHSDITIAEMPQSTAGSPDKQTGVSSVKMVDPAKIRPVVIDNTHLSLQQATRDAIQKRADRWAELRSKYGEAFLRESWREYAMETNPDNVLSDQDFEDGKHYTSNVSLKEIEKYVEEKRNGNTPTFVSRVVAVDYHRATEEIAGDKMIDYVNTMQLQEFSNFLDLKIPESETRSYLKRVFEVLNSLVPEYKVTIYKNTEKRSSIEGTRENKTWREVPASMRVSGVNEKGLEWSFDIPLMVDNILETPNRVGRGAGFVAYYEDNKYKIISFQDYLLKDVIAKLDFAKTSLSANEKIDMFTLSRDIRKSMNEVFSYAILDKVSSSGMFADAYRIVMLPLVALSKSGYIDEITATKEFAILDHFAHQEGYFIRPLKMDRGIATFIPREYAPTFADPAKIHSDAALNALNVKWADRQVLVRNPLIDMADTGQLNVLYTLFSEGNSELFYNVIEGGAILRPGAIKKVYVPKKVDFSFKDRAQMFPSWVREYLELKKKFLEAKGEARKELRDKIDNFYISAKNDEVWIGADKYIRDITAFQVRDISVDAARQTMSIIGMGVISPHNVSVNLGTGGEKKVPVTKKFSVRDKRGKSDVDIITAMKKGDERWAEVMLNASLFAIRDIRTKHLNKAQSQHLQEILDLLHKVGIKYDKRAIETVFLMHKWTDKLYSVLPEIVERTNNLAIGVLGKGIVSEYVVIVDGKKYKVKGVIAPMQATVSTTYRHVTKSNVGGDILDLLTQKGYWDVASHILSGTSIDSPRAIKLSIMAALEYAGIKTGIDKCLPHINIQEIRDDLTNMGKVDWSKRNAVLKEKLKNGAIIALNEKKTIIFPPVLRENMSFETANFLTELEKSLNKFIFGEWSERDYIKYWATLTKYTFGKDGIITNVFDTQDNNSLYVSLVTPHGNTAEARTIIISEKIARQSPSMAKYKDGDTFYALAWRDPTNHTNTIQVVKVQVKKDAPAVSIHPLLWGLMAGDYDKDGVRMWTSRNMQDRFRQIYLQEESSFGKFAASPRDSINDFIFEETNLSSIMQEPLAKAKEGNTTETTFKIAGALGTAMRTATGKIHWALWELKKHIHANKGIATPQFEDIAFKLEEQVISGKKIKNIFTDDERKVLNSVDVQAKIDVINKIAGRLGHNISLNALYGSGYLSVPDLKNFKAWQQYVSPGVRLNEKEINYFISYMAKSYGDYKRSHGRYHQGIITAFRHRTIFNEKEMSSLSDKDYELAVKQKILSYLQNKNPANIYVDALRRLIGIDFAEGNVFLPQSHPVITPAATYIETDFRTINIDGYDGLTNTVDDPFIVYTTNEALKKYSMVYKLFKGDWRYVNVKNFEKPYRIQAVIGTEAYITEADEGTTYNTIESQKLLKALAPGIETDNFVEGIKKFRNRIYAEQSFGKYLEEFEIFERNYTEFFNANKNRLGVEIITFRDRTYGEDVFKINQILVKYYKENAPPTESISNYYNTKTNLEISEIILSKGGKEFGSSKRNHYLNFAGIRQDGQRNTYESVGRAEGREGELAESVGTTEGKTRSKRVQQTAIYRMDEEESIQDAKRLHQLAETKEERGRREIRERVGGMEERASAKEIATHGTSNEGDQQQRRRRESINAQYSNDDTVNIISILLHRNILSKSQLDTSEIITPFKIYQLLSQKIAEIPNNTEKAYNTRKFIAKVSNAIDYVGASQQITHALASDNARMPAATYIEDAIIVPTNKGGVIPVLTSGRFPSVDTKITVHLPAGNYDKQFRTLLKEVDHPDRRTFIWTLTKKDATKLTKDLSKNGFNVRNLNEIVDFHKQVTLFIDQVNKIKSGWHIRDVQKFGVSYEDVRKASTLSEILAKSSLIKNPYLAYIYAKDGRQITIVKEFDVGDTDIIVPKDTILIGGIWHSHQAAEPDAVGILYKVDRRWDRKNSPSEQVDWYMDVVSGMQMMEDIHISLADTRNIFSRQGQPRAEYLIEFIEHLSAQHLVGEVIYSNREEYKLAQKKSKTRLTIAALTLAAGLTWNGIVNTDKIYLPPDIDIPRVQHVTTSHQKSSTFQIPVKSVSESILQSQKEYKVDLKTGKMIEVKEQVAKSVPLPVVKGQVVQNIPAPAAKQQVAQSIPLPAVKEKTSKSEPAPIPSKTDTTGKGAVTDKIIQDTRPVKGDITKSQPTTYSGDKTRSPEDVPPILQKVFVSDEIIGYDDNFVIDLETGKMIFAPETSEVKQYQPPAKKYDDFIQYVGYKGDDRFVVKFINGMTLVVKHKQGSNNIIVDKRISIDPSIRRSIADIINMMDRDEVGDFINQEAARNPQLLWNEQKISVELRNDEDANGRKYLASFDIEISPGVIVHANLKTGYKDGFARLTLPGFGNSPIDVGNRQFQEAIKKALKKYADISGEEIKVQDIMITPSTFMGGFLVPLPLLGKGGMKHKVEIYADGASSGNPGPSGVGVVLISGEHQRSMSKYIGHATNQEAEIRAIIEALKMLKHPEETHATIYTDSQYVIGMLSMGWKAKSNHELIAEAKELISQVGAVEFIKVKGHADNKYNLRADALAVQAIKQGRQGNVPEYSDLPATYIKSSSELPPR